ncbi:unnamed protein product [Diamesa serratosioi]
MMSDVILIDDAEAESEATVENSDGVLKKRKRSQTPPKKIDSDDDEGAVCAICLDNFKQVGDHRITSLKCGHIFGQACIKRWLAEQPSLQRSCPQCKLKASVRDLRFIYASKLRATDNTRELELEKLLAMVQDEKSTMRVENSVIRMELAALKTKNSALLFQIQEIERYRRIDRQGTSNQSDKPNIKVYKMCMEKNIDMTQDGDCRVMTFCYRTRKLLISQKSNQQLFPGYGVRFVDFTTFKPFQFLHMGSKNVRDFAFNSSEDMLVASTTEATCKLFNATTNSSISAFKPSTHAIWAAAFDKSQNRANCLYLGAQNGTTYIYDIRSPNTALKDFITSDITPIISIIPIKPNEDFLDGGFLVVHLRTIYFFEYLPPQEISSTLLNIKGPFNSVTYDVKKDMLLVTTRPNQEYQTSRYIMAKLIKIDSVTALEEVLVFNGGQNLLGVMTRSSLITMPDNCIVAAYLQENKIIQTWSEASGNRMQEISVADIITDTTAIYLENGNTFLGALSSNKCRVFKVNPV